MKLKKLITLAIALVFIISGTSFAESIDLLEKLKTEKSFVIEALTGLEDRDADKHTAWKQSKKQRIFYVTDCEGNCRYERVEILSTLKKFAKDYNQILGREYIIVDSHITSGNSRYHTRFESSQTMRVNNGNLGYFFCHRYKKNRGVTIVGYCQVQLALKYIPIKRVINITIQKAMNTLGIFDTQKLDYKDCLVYDPKGYARYDDLTKHRNKGYQGLCEIEKRAIVFLDQHINKHNHKKYQVAKAFDKHWVSDTTLALDKIDPNWRKKETEKAPKKAIAKKTFSTQPSGNR